MIERYGLVPDSGGAGRYRGGLAIERIWRALTPETTLQVRSDRQRHRPYGLAGGGPGGVVERRHGRPGRRTPPMFSTTIGGPVFHHPMAGGGGWGDPLERDPAAVARDVRDEKVGAAARESCTASSSATTARSTGGDRDAAAPRGVRDAREGSAAMKVGARRGDAARDPARAGVPLVRRQRSSARISFSSPCTRTTASSATASRSARTRARSSRYGLADGAAFRRPRARRTSRRCCARSGREGRWRFWPQFTQLTVSGIEVACWDALGRALGVPTQRVLRRRASATRSTSSASSRATRRESSAATRAELAALGHRGALRQARPQREGRRGRASPRSARRSAAEPASCASTRTRRGDVGDGGRANPAARAVRPRLGRAAGAGRRRQGARARAPLGRHRRSPPTRPSSRRGQLLEVLARGGGGRRSSRAPTTPAGMLPLPAAGDDLPRRTAST